jgi:DNA helicase HerA-like ATPase
MKENEKVGFVVGTKDTSPFSYFVGIEEGKSLQLDDLVLIRENLNGIEIRFYGVVSDVRKSFEGLNFNSENFMVVDGKLPTRISHLAEISVLRVEPEKYIAPTPGNSVEKILNAESAEMGYYFDKMETRIPMGFFKNGLPAYVNYDFINGKKGAHLSVSGISGVATKTSYSTFLLYSILHHPDVDKKKMKTVVFNVKGEDLLFLDKPNKKLTPETLEKYKELKLSGKPFTNVGFYTSGRRIKDGSLMSSSRTRQDLKLYSWNMQEIIEKDLFPYFFTESEDTNIGFLIRQANNYLKRCFRNGDIPLDSVSDFESILELFQQEEIQSQAFKNQHSGSIEAFLRRLSRVAAQCENLIVKHPNKSSAIRWEEHQTTVVDIHNLPSSAQMFVVSTMIREIFRAKEENGTREPLVYIMLDELNQYAPRNGTSPIKDILVDIAERGRSLGIILVGAQQTASEIEKRVYANSAVKVVGRLDAGEAQSHEYQYLPSLMKKRAVILPQGEMMVNQPDIPYPLAVSFPFPAWATTREEVREGGAVSVEEEREEAQSLLNGL